MVEPVAAVRHRRIPVVGIFGYYSSANWGDDVMGRLFAQLVRDAGGEVRLFTTNPDAAYFAGIATARDPAAFVDASDLVVYGGGGLLATKHDDASPFAQAIDAIVNAAQKSSTPVHALSVGGGGQPGSALPGFVRRLLSAADRVTVRNRSDLETVREFNRGAEWYQDVLWLTPSHYRLPASPVGRLTVAVNLSGVASRRRKSVCKQLFRVIGRFRTDIEFVFINSQKVLRKPPIADSERVLASPEADFALINAIDLIVSSKLHLGLVCLSYGKRFVSLFGRPKTHRMFESVGLAGQCLGPLGFLLFPLRFLSRRFTDRMLKPIEFDGAKDIAKIVESAEGHASVLTRIIRESRDR